MDNSSKFVYFENVMKYNPRRSKVWKVLCRYIEREFPSESSVLDLGAGYCDFINYVTATDKYAVDINPIVRQYAAKDVTALVRDCTNMDNFDSNLFDVVFASHLLEHLKRKDIKKAVTEVKRILKHNGIFILLQPNYRYCYRQYFDDYTHKTVFDHVSLTQMLQSEGFSIDKVEPRFLPYSMDSKLPKGTWLVWFYLRLPVRPFAKQMYVVARLEK